MTTPSNARPRDEAFEAALASVRRDKRAARDPAAARAELDAAIPAIERAALKRAAEHILLLGELSRGYLCPACHGKPATTPRVREGRTGYACGCGQAWEPPKLPDWNMQPETLLRKLARGEALPELPAKTGG